MCGKKGILLLLVLLLFASAMSAQDVRLKIAVVGLSNPATLHKSNIGNALVDILVIVLCAIMAGAEGWVGETIWDDPLNWIPCN